MVLREQTNYLVALPQGRSTKSDNDGVSYIVLCTDGHYSIDDAVRVKLPILSATEEHLEACDYQILSH